jgi:macrodomain Ter protein organizer (MatP/YcbG family)
MNNIVIYEWIDRSKQIPGLKDFLMEKLKFWKQKRHFKIQKSGTQQKSYDLKFEFFNEKIFHLDI